MRSKLCIAAAVVLLAGCHELKPGKAVRKELSGSDPQAQLEFWHELADEPIASNDQAFRALLLYLDDKDDAANYDARVATLRTRNLLPTDFAEPAEAGVTRGTFAYALMRLLNEKGGLTTRVFGIHPRYAVRELQFLEVLPPSTPNQGLSGNDVVGIIGRVEDFQRSTTETPDEAVPEHLKDSGQK